MCVWRQGWAACVWGGKVAGVHEMGQDRAPIYRSERKQKEEKFTIVHESCDHLGVLTTLRHASRILDNSQHS